MTTNSHLFSALQSRLMQWQYLGIERFAGGAVKIGHLPQVGPLAYLHTIFAPLEEEELALLQEWLGRPVPAAVADFYRCANGFRAFSGAFGMYGMIRARTQPRRQRADLLPFDILVPNGHERPPGLAPDKIVIGSYSFDGSNVYVGANGEIGVCKRERGAVELRRWDSFADWLNTESVRIEKLFDEQGRLLTDNASNASPCTV